MNLPLNFYVMCDSTLVSSREASYTRNCSGCLCGSDMLRSFYVPSGVGPEEDLMGILVLLFVNIGVLPMLPRFELCEEPVINSCRY